MKLKARFTGMRSFSAKLWAASRSLLDVGPLRQALPDRREVLLGLVYGT